MVYLAKSCPAWLHRFYYTLVFTFVNIPWVVTDVIRVSVFPVDIFLIPALILVLILNGRNGSAVRAI